MEYYSFIGYLVVGLGVIASLFIAVFTPLSKMVKQLAEIKVRLDNIDNTLGGHSNKIEEHEKRLNNHDVEIEKLKK